MSTIYNTLVITHDETSTNDQRDLYAETGYKELAGLKIVDFMRKVCSGSHPATILTRINTAKATGTITLASFVADDTVTINGIVFTGKASPSGAVQFACGVTDTADAAALVVVLNAHTTINKMVIATSALGVVTLTALVPGALGNAVTTAISAHGSVAGARLTGGDNGDTETTHYFGSAT